MDTGNDFKGVKIPDGMKERFNNSDTKIIIVSTKGYSIENLKCSCNVEEE